jgi:hypothetical protein
MIDHAGVKSSPCFRMRTVSERRENNLKGFEDSTCQNLALTVLHVPYSLDSSRSSLLNSKCANYQQVGCRVCVDGGVSGDNILACAQVPPSPPWSRVEGKSYVNFPQMPPPRGGFFMWELTKETLHLPLGCLQSGFSYSTTFSLAPRCLPLISLECVFKFVLQKSINVPTNPSTYPLLLLTSKKS